MSTPDATIGTLYLEEALKTFQKQKTLGEKALAQVSDDARLNATLDPESNSLAIIVKHMAGNMVSRWTDFLTTDGEKPDRNRNGEFEGEMSRAELMARWERGWACVFSAVSALTPDDLLKTVTIRSEPHTVVRAIDRQIDHYGYHVGQIVFLAKHLESEHWQSLSVARGKSAEFKP